MTPRYSISRVFYFTILGKIAEKCTKPHKIAETYENNLMLVETERIHWVLSEMCQIGH